MKSISRILFLLLRISLFFSVGLVACRPVPATSVDNDLLAKTSPSPAAISTANSYSTQAPAFKNTDESDLISTMPVGEVATQQPESTLPTEQPSSMDSLMGIEIRSTKGIDLVQQAGVYWVRRNALLWSRVEPNEGEREWGEVASLEQDLIDISTKGLHTILIIRGTPLWAQKLPGYYCGPVAVEKFDAFGRFLHDAVQRYSAPPFNVQYFELWNEPDVPPAAVPPDMVFGCWGDPASHYYGGEDYGRMLQVVYPQVKAANPNAQLVLGGLLLDCDPNHPPETIKGSGELKDCTSSKFLSGVLENGGGAFFDGISFHSYDYYSRGLGRYSNYNWSSTYSTDGPSLIAKTQYILGVLDEYRISGKFLMNTESALICGPTGKEDFCLTGDYQSTKAIYAVHALAAGGAVGLRANIWYSLTGWRGSALVDPSSVTLPAYEAISFYSKLLPESTYLGQEEFYQDVPIQLYRYKTSSSTVWVLWSTDEMDHEIFLDDPPKIVFDLYGNPLSTGFKQVVGIFPIYMVWDGLR